MSKVSSNAGKHPYLRPENASLFDDLISEKEGLPFLPDDKVKFVHQVETEFVDKKKKTLFFRDVVTYNQEEYEVNYDSKNFCWIIRSLNDPKKVEKLREKADLTIFKKRHN
jgi:hypothetical protein